MCTGQRRLAGVGALHSVWGKRQPWRGTRFAFAGKNGALRSALAGVSLEALASSTPFALDEVGARDATSFLAQDEQA